MQLGEERGKYINKICKTKGCYNKARSAGYCLPCYNRRLKENKK